MGQSCEVVAPTLDLEILAVHRQTAFTFDSQGRMIHESSPLKSPGRRFSFAGCQGGNLAVIRADVPDEVAGYLRQLVATEPPLAQPESVPIHLEEYRELLAGTAAPVDPYHGLLWVFPEVMTDEAQTDVVLSGTRDGDELFDRLPDAMPASLEYLGFRSQDDLWEPWCIAMVNGKIASIAETVRVGSAGAEVGVDTTAELRGLGLGAAVTAGWSGHPGIAQSSRFYSTARENTSSRRLAGRLGLRFLGSTFAIE